MQQRQCAVRTGRLPCGRTTCCSTSAIAARGTPVLDAIGRPVTLFAHCDEERSTVEGDFSRQDAEHIEGWVEHAHAQVCCCLNLQAPFDTPSPTACCCFASAQEAIASSFGRQVACTPHHSLHRALLHTAPGAGASSSGSKCNGNKILQIGIGDA